MDKLEQNSSEPLKSSAMLLFTAISMLLVNTNNFSLHFRMKTVKTLSLDVFFIYLFKTIIKRIWSMGKKMDIQLPC